MKSPSQCLIRLYTKLPKSLRTGHEWGVATPLFTVTAYWLALLLPTNDFKNRYAIFHQNFARFIRSKHITKNSYLFRAKFYTMGVCYYESSL